MDEEDLEVSWENLVNPVQMERTEKLDHREFKEHLE